MYMESLGQGKRLPPASNIRALKIELNSLPNYLSYEFLGKNATSPVIVRSDLNDEQFKKLLRVLREHKKAVGWTI